MKGHASLIRTIIGGAQIIDMMILVIDANKGIQTQTAECLVIGEITTDVIIVALNKVDSIPPDEREAKIERMKKRLRKVFSTTKFRDPPIVCTAAAVGGEKVASVGAAAGKDRLPNEGIDQLIKTIESNIHIPRRNPNSSLYYSIDHCFPIKGHGTVLTGTVLSGSVKINDEIWLPNLDVSKKVKSMQMFRKSVKYACQGDRVALCVTNLDPKLIERGIAATPGSIPLLSSVIVMVKKIRYFRSVCKSNSKYHITIGHTTVVATATFFGATELAAKMGVVAKANNAPYTDASDMGREGDGGGEGSKGAANETDNIIRDMLDDLSHQPASAAIPGLEGTESNIPDLSGDGESCNKSKNDDSDDDDTNSTKNSIAGGGKGGAGHSKSNNSSNSSSNSNSSSSGGGSAKLSSASESSVQAQTLAAAYSRNFPNDIQFQWDKEDFQYQDELIAGENFNFGQEPIQYALLQLQHPVFCPIDSLLIGSRLDADIPKDGNHPCRLAFYGPIKNSVTDDDLVNIKLYHWKQKELEVFRLTDVRNGLCLEMLGWKLIGEGSDIRPFLGMRVETTNGDVGIISASYGSDGKFKVKFPFGAKITTSSKLILRFKRYVFDKSKSMHQFGVPEPTNSYPTQYNSLNVNKAVEAVDAKKSSKESEVSSQSTKSIKTAPTPSPVSTATATAAATAKKLTTAPSSSEEKPNSAPKNTDTSSNKLAIKIKTDEGKSEATSNTGKSANFKTIAARPTSFSSIAKENTSKVEDKKEAPKVTPVSREPAIKVRPSNSSIADLIASMGGTSAASQKDASKDVKNNNNINNFSSSSSSSSSSTGGGAPWKSAWATTSQGTKSTSNIPNNTSNSIGKNSTIIISSSSSSNGATITPSTITAQPVASTPLNLLAPSFKPSATSAKPSTILADNVIDTTPILTSKNNFNHSNNNSNNNNINSSNISNKSSNDKSINNSNNSNNSNSSSSNPKPEKTSKKPKAAATAAPSAAQTPLVPVVKQEKRDKFRVGKIESFKICDIEPPQATDPTSGSVLSGNADDATSKEIVAIVNGAFTMEENIRDFIGCEVLVKDLGNNSNISGFLIGPFAKMGKCKVRFTSPFRGDVGYSVYIPLSVSK